MADFTKMTLKILYSLDNSTSGTYLARSKKLQCVREATIPNPDPAIESDISTFRIGAVDLALVLQEIYVNSPELLHHNIAKAGHDYNLYYRDICELDEPLVSLGLLSQIRQKMDKDVTQESHQFEESEDEEPFIVTGRVCSNFAALLKRSYSSSGNNKQGKSPSSSADTLEVKLRFIRVATAKDSRRPSTSIPGLQKIPVPTTLSNQMNFKNSNNSININVASRTVRPRVPNPAKRQTNPTPAPKAERTQSLPIWSLKQGQNHSGLATNSIAHRIFLADRKTENVQTKAGYQQATTYQISALQQDSTVQKFRVDDSVSKRFDFMLNKKKKQQNPAQQQHQRNQETMKSNGINSARKSSTAAKARRFNTMAAVPTPLVDTISTTKYFAKPKQRGASISNDLTDTTLEQESVFQQLLANSPAKKNNPVVLAEEGKENLPPSNIPTDNIDLDLLNFSEVNLKGDLDWFGTYDPFNSPVLPDVFAEHALKPSSTTPKDPNTCNTVDIENVEEEDNTPRMTENDKADPLSDVDRTSPIDTLSMPLMELNDRPSNRMVSCQEQLRRLPLLGHHQKAASDAPQELFEGELRAASEEENNDEDATSVVMNYSSSYHDDSPRVKDSPSQKKIAIYECSSPLSKRNHDKEDSGPCDDEDERKENFKKQRIMPSSPTMFTYPDDISSNADASDLFSSFMHGPQGQINDADSTPATQYQNQSSDHMKN